MASRNLRRLSTSFAALLVATAIAAPTAHAEQGLAATAGSAPQAVTAPGPPTDVQAEPRDKRATVSWVAPTDDGGLNGLNYLVTSSPGGFVCKGRTSPCTVTGLTDGVSYTFVVQVSNGMFVTASDPSAPVTPNPTVSDPPRTVTATYSTHQAQVRWRAPADDGGSPITGYTVTSEPGGQTCTSATTSCSLAHLTNGMEYDFAVSAVNGVGTSAPGHTWGTPRAATALTLTSVPGLVSYGARIPVLAKVTIDGKASPGLTVRLQYRRAGTIEPFTTSRGQARSSATGLVRFTTFRPPYPVQLRVTTALAGAHLGSESASRTVRMTPTISFAADATRVYRRNVITFSGVVHPWLSKEKVTLQRKIGSRWATVKSTRADGTASYWVSARMWNRGTRTYRLVTAAYGNVTAGVSRTVSIRVR